MPRPLRVGVQLPEVEREVRFDEYRAMARAAEEVGFDSIWLGDHLLYREPERPERGPWEVWTLLAGIAAVTERAEIGPLVACTAFHSPGILAKMAATVDEVSGGRLVLGLGAGWNEAEFRAFGLPFSYRVSRFEECFEAIRRLLAGEHVTLEGRFHRLEECVLLPRPARRPPLMVGSIGERMLGITLPHVERWNTWYEWYGNSVEGFAKQNAWLTERAQAAGRDPDELERSVSVFVALEGADSPEARSTESPPLTGGPGALAEHLSGLAEAGCDEAIIVLEPIDEPSIRALAPALAELGPPLVVAPASA